jgi:4-diphosphocytidyl-2-C-methyl-D-erythritol kinase
MSEGSVRVEMRVPAKVNLSLLVGPTRSDGYHELFSVFVPIDLYDDLEFDLTARRSGVGAGTLQVDCEVASGEANLAARALRSLQRATGWVLDGRIAIRKGIPVGAGLGGGSADAAAALRAGAEAIVAAGGSAPDEHTLLTLAREVGADVPFFLRPRPSVARGVGDVLEPLALPPLPLVLVFHQHQLSTVSVYQTYDRLTGGRSGAPTEGTAPTGEASDSPRELREFQERAGAAEALWRALADEWNAGRLESGRLTLAIAGLLENDLETASFHLLPSLREAKAALLGKGVRGAVMSGSGPTLLGVCPTRDEAEESSRRLGLRGYRTRSALAAALP